jgi:hypothetical protein
MVFINTALENADDAISGVEDSITGVESVSKNSEFKLLNDANGYSLYNPNGINGTIRVMDVTGRLLWSSETISKSHVYIDMTAYSQGVYFVNVERDGVYTYSSKIIR